MATQHYNQRAQEKVSLYTTVFRFLDVVNAECERKSVVHGIRGQLISLLKKRREKEAELLATQREAAGGFWAYMKRIAKLRELKAVLSNLNSTIIGWMDTISSHLMISSKIGKTGNRSTSGF